MKSVLAAVIMFCPDSHTVLLVALHHIAHHCQLVCNKKFMHALLPALLLPKLWPSWQTIPMPLVSYPRARTREEEEKWRKKKWRASFPLFSLPR